jgi:hypothetical protein
MSLAMRINSMRNAVSKHEQLSRRVSSLDWTRDPEMSVAINMDLSRPDRLDSLASSVPQLMMDLAGKKVVDADFSFVAWRPHKRTRPILVPAPQNTVDDAMEAILEEMDSAVEDRIEEFDVEIETSDEIDVTVNSDELSIQETEGVNSTNDVAVDIVTPIESVSEDIDAELDEDMGSLEKEDSKEIISEDKSEEILVEIEVPVIEQEDVDLGTESTDSEEDVVKISVDEDEGGVAVFEGLLRSLGLESDADLLQDSGDVSAITRKIASHVGVEPRDMRLDRLLRLSLRLMPKEDGQDAVRFGLIKTLSELATVLSKWTRTRLEARHNGSKGFLLEDAANLGIALERIPGPGTPIPLDADGYDLPAFDDIEGLSNEVNVLNRRIRLTSSGGVR